MPATRVLAIVAHPDDTAYFMGGTLALWAMQGEEIALLVATNGDIGTSDPDARREDVALVRQQEEQASAAKLGIASVQFLGQPDAELQASAELVAELTAGIRAWRPSRVVTLDPTCLVWRDRINHADHRALGDATVRAVFPAATSPLAYPELLSRGLGPHDVGEIWLAGSDVPNHGVDITETFETKLAALACHRSQIKNPATLRDKVARDHEVIDRFGRRRYAEKYRVVRLD